MRMTKPKIKYCLLNLVVLIALHGYGQGLSGEDGKLNKKSIAVENSLEGTEVWVLTNPATQREIEGYASLTSVAQGDSIDLFVNTASPNYRMDVYRMGWYQGLGARHMFGPILRKGTVQPIPKPQEDTGLIECDWSDPYTLKIEKDWTQGVYLVKLQEDQTQKQSYILFVVRDDASIAPILFQLPVSTYQAYNFWGGKSLYATGSGDALPWGAETGIAATKVSYNRPYAFNNNQNAANGIGAGEFLTNNQIVWRGYPISSAGWNYNMVRWLEKKGYELNYCTNIDTHNGLDLLKRHALFLSQGHDEYWTDQMRDNLEIILQQGSNVAFFGGNSMYYQIRFEPSKITGKPFRIQVCYKDRFDPVTQKESSMEYRDLDAPESAFLGVQYFADAVDGDFVVANPNHPFFEGTDLKKNDRLPGLLGYEVDHITEDSPKNIEILGSSKAYIKKPSQVSRNSVIKNIIMHLHKPWVFIGNTLFWLVLLVFYNKVQKRVPLFSSMLFKALLVLLLAANMVVVYFIDQINKKNIAHMTVYTTDSGTKVFSAGTIQWSWGLDDYNAPELRTSRLNKDAEIITENILNDLGKKKH